MTPCIALKFSVANAPCDLICFEMPSAPNVLERLCFFLDNLTTTGLFKVLDGEASRAVNGWFDENVSLSISDGDSGSW